MAEVDFYVRNGLVVNNNILFVNATSQLVGINNSAPDATLTVTGTANVSGRLGVGGIIAVAGNATFAANLSVTGQTSFNANVTGPGTSSYLDGFTIDCGTYS